MIVLISFHESVITKQYVGKRLSLLFGADNYSFLNRQLHDVILANIRRRVSLPIKDSDFGYSGC